MPFPVGAAIAAGASLLGGVLRDRAQRKAAREQMAFQERMSSTAYGRAMADMRMSGLNPMLAYQQGGASTPGGAQPNLEDVLSPAVSSAMHAKRMAEDIRLVRADVDLKRQTLKDVFMHTQLQARLRDQAEAQTNLLKLEGAHSAAGMARALQEERISSSSAGRVLEWIKRVRESVFGGAGILIGPRIGGGRYR